MARDNGRPSEIPDGQCADQLVASQTQVVVVSPSCWGRPRASTRPSFYLQKRGASVGA